MKQAVTRVEDHEYELFQRTAANLGTTPSDVLRMFIYAFNDHHGFPYAVQSQRMQVELSRRKRKPLILQRALLWRPYHETR